MHNMKTKFRMGIELFCPQCKFWDNKRFLSVAEKAGNVGLCRVRSPLMVDEDGFGIFPLMTKIDWCDEWKPSEKEAMRWQEVHDLECTTCAEKAAKGPANNVNEALADAMGVDIGEHDTRQPAKKETLN